MALNSKCLWICDNLGERFKQQLLRIFFTNAEGSFFAIRHLMF